MNSKGDNIKRSALGRNGFIGELYNARSENLTSRSLFLSTFPSVFIKKQDTSRTEIDFQATENVTDRFELLKIEGELQIPVLCDLITVEGSGKFLKEEKKSHKNVSWSLVCKYQTVSEKIFTGFDEILKYIDLSTLTESEYTHFVSEINWGANCLLTLESHCGSESERKEIEGFLKGKLSFLADLISSKLKCDATDKKNKTDNKNNFIVKVCADFLSDKPPPTSIQGFADYIANIPSLLKKVNNGKGKPLSYTLIPLSTIKKLAKVECITDALTKSIDESFLISTVCLFEEITEMKRNLYDFLQEMTECKKYVDNETFMNARKQQEILKLKECELKQIISEDLLKVKSGEKPLKDLIRRVDKFRSQDLKLYSYEEYLDSCAEIRHKITSIKNYISSGATYLGIGEKFTHLINQNVSCEFIVLVFSTEIDKNDSLLFQNTCHYFLTLVQDRAINTKYVVVDLDLDKTTKFLNFELATCKILHFKGSDLLSSDLYGEYVLERESNFMRVGKAVEIDPVQHKPGNRVVVEMICPGFKKGSCSSDKVQWKCFRCKANLEYGFGEDFYCQCGRAPKTSFECRCSDLKHGNEFILPNESFLTEQLSLLRPFKELNILILGQSGVGKSTWINSITNYLSYETLQEAKERGVLCEIPLTIPAYSKSMKKYMIQIGEARNSEDTSAGNSATQCSHTYSFLWEDKYVRLIDTPGVGDTRGIDQDKANMRNIVQHISHLQELHGICILIKANDNRMNAVFSYCVQELLIHMHKSVAKNIVFCFTNARSSFYTPGQSSVILENLLNKLEVKNELTPGAHNMFCLDNEAFLFLCTLSEPDIHYEDHLVKSFEQSWEISLKETRRMLQTIKNFTPHPLKDTVSLITARSRILALTKPIAEISKTIQMNLNAIQRKQDEIQKSNQTIEELKSKLHVKIYKLETYPLKYPRTVCTEPQCVTYLKTDDSDYQSIEYKTHCHAECYLKNVSPSTINNSRLRFCSAMDEGYCTKCGCCWRVHMHLAVGQKRVPIPVEDFNIKINLQQQISDKQKVESFVKFLKESTESYEKEQEIIIQTSVKFGMFLKNNAISVFNDSISDYLKYLIREEENKPYKTESEMEIIENLKKTLNAYEAEYKVLSEVVNKGETHDDNLTSQDILALEQKLYELKLTGKDIKLAVETARAATEGNLQYTETPLKVAPKSSNLPKNKPSKNWFKKIF